MRISDWSSDVCSSDLLSHPPCRHRRQENLRPFQLAHRMPPLSMACSSPRSASLRSTRYRMFIAASAPWEAQMNRLCEQCLSRRIASPARSEEHTSELQSLMRISYAVFCLNKKKDTN